MLVRTAWLVTAVLTLGLQLLALPNLARDIPPETQAAIAQDGLSSEFFAAWVGLSGLVVALVFAIAGGLLIWRRPDERMAQFAAFALLLFGSVTATGQGPSPLADYPILVTVYHILDLFGRAAFTIFVFVFPDGRFVPRWTRWLALLWIAVQVPRPFNDLSLVTPIMPVIDALTGPLFVVGLIAAAASQVYRYRRVSTPAQRRQTRWTAIGFALALGLFLLASGVQIIVPAARQPLPSLILLTVQYIALPLIPVSIVVALLRHGLFDVDILIGRALVYAALTATTVIVFILVVGYLSLLFRTQDNLLISLLGTGAVAVTFQPIRERVQRTVNRLLYGQRDEPYTVLSDFRRRLDSSDEWANVLSSLVETVATAMKLPYVSLHLIGDNARLVEAASLGILEGSAEHLPLTHSGRQIGEMVVGRRGRSDPFDAADRRLLDDLARQAAAALYAVRLTIELQRSRERLVTAREEERRRLRRDLHDGLGPTLAALGLKIETARNKIGRNSAADAVLADLSERTRDAVADIRRLVYELRPPALDDLGLVGALEQLIATAEPPLHVCIEVSADGLPPLSAATEVAAYRIAQEAYTNVVRHARATECTIRLQHAGALQISIEDNGTGLRDSVHRGVGLTSMRERAEELGGTFNATPGAIRGTYVEATLPLAHVEALV